MLNKLLGLIGLPSPAVLVGVLLAMGAVAGLSYNLGDKAGFNRAEAARAHAQDGAIDVLRQELASTRAESVAQAAARGEAAAAADRAKAGLSSALKELRDAKNRPAASCIPDDWRVRVNAAIGAANQPLAGSRDTGILPIKLPAPPGARIGFGPVGGGLAGGGGGVPAAARDVPAPAQ